MKFTVVLLFAYFLQTFAGYGDEVSGYPNWQERAAHAVSNAVRSDPSNYVPKYASDFSPSMSGVLNGYAAKAPYYWTQGLNNAARTYSDFLSKSSGCFGHGFCNGTNTGSFITSYYSCASNGWAENIAAGYNEPRKTINQWLCDGNPCIPAGGNAGHRDNILDKKNYRLTTIGNGYVYRSGSTYSAYWTQDFGAATCPAIANKIYSGSHIFQNSGKIKFLATFYDSSSAAPAEASIFISGTKYSLTLDLGSAALGTYIYETTTATSCREYYFLFKDSAGNSHYYPETGSLQTFNEGGCTTAWSARSSSSGSAAATSASATSAAATTAAAATSAAAATTAAAATSAAATSGVFGEVSTTSATSAAATSGVFGEVSTSTTSSSTTGAALYYGPTITYVLLTFAGSVTGFKPEIFAQAIGNSVGISAERVVVQNVADGDYYDTIQVDFTVLEMTGEMSSYDVMYALYNKIVDGDSVFLENGLDLYAFRGYFINNPSGASIPSAPSSEPSLSATPPAAGSASKKTNVAMIGGIVGGAVGLIAVIGVVVAVVVIRKKRGGSPGSFF